MRERTAKAALLVVSLVLIGGAFVTFPIASSTAGPLAVAEHVVPAAEATSIAAPPAFASPRRDPFGDAPSQEAPTPIASASPAVPVVASALPPIPGIPLLPPNAGAGEPRATPAAGGEGTSAIVRAVVTGDHAFALVEVGSAIRIVTRGDRVAGALVTSVDAGGILLDSGKRFALAPPGPADRKGEP